MTVLVKADSVDEGCGISGTVEATFGANESEADAAGAKDKVTTVSAGWKVIPAEVVKEANPGKHTPATQGLTLLDAASVIGNKSEADDASVNNGAFDISGTTKAEQATGGVMSCGGGSDTLLAVTVTEIDSVMVAYTVRGTEFRYVTDPRQLG